MLEKQWKKRIREWELHCRKKFSGKITKLPAIFIYPFSWRPSWSLAVKCYDCMRNNLPFSFSLKRFLRFLREIPTNIQRIHWIIVSIKTRRFAWDEIEPHNIFYWPLAHLTVSHIISRSPVRFVHAADADVSASNLDGPNEFKSTLLNSICIQDLLRSYQINSSCFIILAVYVLWDIMYIFSLLAP